MNVTEELHKIAELFEERGKIYGEGYKLKGAVIDALFEKPIILSTAEDFNRFSILNYIVGKLVRYSNNFIDSGHDDSLDDISVYAQMLKELDNEKRIRLSNLKRKPQELDDA